MADSVQPIITISSYARRSGDQIHLVLDIPSDGGITAGAAEVRVKGPRATARASATVTPVAGGSRVQASLPARSLKADVYRLALRPNGQDTFQRLQARLVVSPTQPIALLPGPAPRTRILPPRPQQVPTVRGRAERAAAGVVGKALRRLPEDRADRYRTTLRKLARRRP